MEVIKNITAGQIIDILKQNGYPNVSRFQEDDVLVEVNGTNYLLTLENIRVLKAIHIISDLKISCETVNNWNKIRAYSRALLVKDSIALDAELCIAAGVHRENIIEFFSTFLDSCAVFNEYLLENLMSEEIGKHWFWDADDIP